MLPSKVNLQTKTLLFFQLFQFPGWHSQPLWDEASQDQHLRGVVPTHHVSKEARRSEGAAVDRVWVGEGPGLRRRGQGVVLPALQGDVQPLLRPVWILGHVSLRPIALLSHSGALTKHRGRTWRNVKWRWRTASMQTVEQCLWCRAATAELHCCSPARPVKSFLLLSSHWKSHPGTDVSHTQRIITVTYVLLLFLAPPAAASRSCFRLIFFTIYFCHVGERWQQQNAAAGSDTN